MGLFKYQSIQQRFVTGLAAVITCVLLIYATVLINYNTRSTLIDLEAQVTRLLDFSMSSLSSALWQFNDEFINDYVNSLFLYDDVVYVGVSNNEKDVTSKTRKSYDGIDFNNPNPADYISKTKEIPYHDVNIGKIKIVLSKSRIGTQIVYGSLATISLLLLIISFLFITVYWLSNKYIFNPLKKLEHSARLISDGNLDTPIDTTGHDEISHLAQTFKQMIGNIKSITSSRDELNHQVKERLRVEKALLKSEALLEATQKLSKIGGWEYDIANETCLWTTETFRIFGFTSQDGQLGQEKLLQAGSKCFAEHDLRFLSQTLSKCLSEQIPFDLELPLTSRTGELLWIRIMAEPLIENSNYVKIVGSIIDITESKTTQTALETSQETFLSVLDGIDATIYVSDIDNHNILFMNKHMKTTYGADHTGKKCWKIFRGTDKECSFCTNEKLLDSNGIPTGVHIWTEQNQITGRWVINHDRAIKWLDGKYVRLQIATDITDLKNLENELRQAHKMESIGRLAGGIAHDFNNILAAISGFSQLALDGLPADSQAAADINEVVGASNRAALLVKQILSFSRKEQKNLSPVNLPEVLSESLVLLRATIPSTIEIIDTIESEEKLVLADATMLHQVIINICTNASHAMEEKGGRLEVELRIKATSEITSQHVDAMNAPQYAVMTFKDNGSGIDAKICQHIFDPYFTTKEVGKGSGMGLAVVHGVINSHHGFIDVDSTPGIGTTFTIYLPSVDSEYKVLEDIKDLPAGDERILIVDDESAIVLLTTRRLENLGYRVTPTTKSTEALELFKKNPNNFDLIISDQTMPQLRGDQLAREILAVRPEIPIIICTGYSSQITTDRATIPGVKSCLSKPVDYNLLANTIRKELDSSKPSEKV